LSAFTAARVRVGQIVTATELAELERAEARETAYNKALRFLEPRPRSVAEVREHLVKKKIANDVIDETLARLKDAGLLDDAAFAKYWVENRETFRPRAGRALRYELKRKGIADSAIGDVLGEIDESDSAYRAVANRAQRWSNLERREFMDKVSAFLVRRGFGYDIAKSTAKRLWDEK
jgi:regulatory protein